MVPGGDAGWVAEADNLAFSADRLPPPYFTKANLRPGWDEFRADFFTFPFPKPTNREAGINVFLTIANVVKQGAAGPLGQL